jgi:hypothetical protein
MRNLVVALWLLVAMGSTVVATETALGPQPGVLLLLNGSVIEGQILRAGNRFDVSQADSDLHIRTTDVAFAGRDLADCYEFRRREIDLTRAQDHLDLAEWCLRHGLLDNADQELREGAACDPKHPKIALIERRLQLATTRSQSVANGTPAAPAAASNEELDRMVRGMPTRSVEVFASTIQPLLLNQCATAACHGPGSTGTFRLMRVSAGRAQSRRATQRNLHAVLGTIDTDVPDRSTLLTAPVKPHGGSQSAIFTNRETQQYKQLVDWAYMVASRKPPESAREPRANEWPLAENAPPIFRAQKRSSSSANVKAGFQTNEASAVDEAGDDESTPEGGTDEAEADTIHAPKSNAKTPARLSRRHLAGQSSVRSMPKRGELPEKEEPRDPFDPAQFNKKYLGDE